jgi:hypothetical protein
MASGGLSITADTATSFLSAAVASPPAQGTNPVPAASAEPADKPTDVTAQAAAVDTVALSNKVQQPKQEPPKEEPLRKRSEKQEPAPGKIGDILFVYNPKGKVRIRFMDSSNNLIYQVPPVMLSRMMDLMQTLGSQVSIKA